MKPRKSFLIKTLLSLTVALCLLSVGIFHIFASAAQPLDIDNSSFAPDVEFTPDVSINDGSTPVSKDQHNAKFDIYTHISEKDGGRIATVYSKEQIADIQNSRADGKWMYLTGEEALYLLDDTMKLFQEYDTVVINDLRGVEHTFHGVPFYSSPEYESSFGKVSLENGDASYDLRRDLYEAMLYRVEALQSGITRQKLSGKGQEMVAYINMSEATDQASLDLYRHTIIRYFLGNDYLTTKNVINMEDELRSFDFGALTFYQERVYYVKDLSLVDQAKWIELYPDGMFEPYSGLDKYDQNAEKVVVIELWEESTGNCIAKLRLDSVSNAQEIDKIQALWNELEGNIGSVPSSEYSVLTDYRVVVYLNGFASVVDCTNFRYQPDGNLNKWQFNPADSTFEPLCLAGSQAIAEYINHILSQKLTQN